MLDSVDRVNKKIGEMMAYSGNASDYKVAVVYGGISGEREVSLNSGKSSAAALREIGFEVELIDSAEKADLVRLLEGGFDVAFLALHGRGGEDGTIQGFLETAGIPYTGSGVLASAMAINKSKAKELYELAGLRVAPSQTVGAADILDDQDMEEILESVGGLPCVGKPATEGSSLGMTIVRASEDLPAALETALSVDEEALVEGFVEGTELTVAVMGNEEPVALPVIQIVATEDEFYNYHAKYAAGGSRHLCPAPLTPVQAEQAQDMALAAHAVLGCRGISRSDIILDAEGQCWILETNTLPGMTGTSLVPDAARAAGIEFPQLCEKLVALALEK